ncbi:MAG: peptide chain release factor N(5)-glutamine methyltransferase [Actinobacteria bacterium]|nr:peptide chain release factor N(5)-glutamine methyltransferase [Actinomycetota bacterium]
MGETMAAPRKTRLPADREAGHDDAYATARPDEAGTLREALNSAEASLAVAGVDAPRLDAELLLAHALGVSRPQLITRLNAPLTRIARTGFSAALARRAAREPLAYITGEKGFRGIVLRVDQNVLIPRPETELLVDVVKTAAPASVLDVATGSGAVALALADELPSAAITATDVSPDALAVAAENAHRLGFGDRVQFIRADLLVGVGGEFNVIAANLPYVRAGEIDALQPEIAFEPRAALDGGPDGLDLVRVLVAQVAAGFAVEPPRAETADSAPEPPPMNDTDCAANPSLGIETDSATIAARRPALAPGGLIALEIGDDQGPAVTRILTDAGFEDAVVHQDLTGRDRVVAARAPQ